MSQSKMRYVPYHKLNTTPNIIVDGAANPHTVLTLSHWPKSGTPHELKDDLSAQIVFRYLDSTDFRVTAEAVSNNHFDEDGLISLYSMLNPEEALRNRELLIDIAAAGDFGTYRFPEGVRIFFIISALANEERSSLPRRMFDQAHEDLTADLYQELLNRLPEIIRDPHPYRKLWEEDERLLRKSETAIREGKIGIEEVPALDLAIITIPKEYANAPAIALHNFTKCFRILKITGDCYEFYYRYETWVQYVSRRPLPRADLHPLAEKLTFLEGSGGSWAFDGVESIVPYLRRQNETGSRIPPHLFRTELEQYMATASSAYNPFD